MDLKRGVPNSYDKKCPPATVSAIKQGKGQDIPPPLTSGPKVGFPARHHKLHIATRFVQKMSKDCAWYDVGAGRAATLDGSPDVVQATVLVKLLESD